MINMKSHALSWLFIKNFNFLVLLLFYKRLGMSRLLRMGFVLSFAFLIGLMGYRFSQYLFDTSLPVIAILGVEQDHYYCNDVHCIIEGQDEYKIKHLSIKVDDTILLNNHKINNSKFEYHITIPTLSLENGPHKLIITAVDASKKANTTVKVIDFYVDNTPLNCILLKQDDQIKISQGNTLHLQFQSSKDILKATIKALSYDFQFCKESSRSYIYECFVPIATDEIPNEYLAVIEIEDHVGNKRKIETAFEVVSFPFKTQTIAVDSHRENAPAGCKSENDFKDMIALVSAQSKNNKLWNGAFFVPCVSQRVSTDFGVMRISREYGRYTHNGVDFVAAPKSPVWASQDGVLVIKEDFVHTGKTVAIDHGCGVVTIYGHLDEYTSLDVGSVIKKGNIIGKIGKTGYATGYHLHFEMRIGNVPVNPMEWIR